MSFVSPEWIDRTLPPDRAPGVAGLHEALGKLHYLLPDLTTKIVKTVTDGDSAAVHLLFSGTHGGDLPGVPATHQPISFIAFDMHRVQGGRIVESWHLEDNLSLLTQLGMLPTRK